MRIPETVGADLQFGKKKSEPYLQSTLCLPCLGLFALPPRASSASASLPRLRRAPPPTAYLRRRTSPSTPISLHRSPTSCCAASFSTLPPIDSSPANTRVGGSPPAEAPPRLGSKVIR